MENVPESPPVLLYDGVCGLCNKTVQSVIKRDKRGAIRFAALQSDYGEAARARHPEMLKNVDSVVLLEKDNDGKERVFVRSDAALRVGTHLGGRWKILAHFM